MFLKLSYRSGTDAFHLKLHAGQFSIEKLRGAFPVRRPHGFNHLAGGAELTSYRAGDVLVI